MRLLFIIPILFLAACNATYNAPPVTAQQAALIANPTPEVLAQVEKELPAFLAEDDFVERVTAAVGRPLDAREMQIARLVGIKHPEKVRIAVVPRIPSQNRQQAISNATGVAFPAKAITGRYSIIFAKPFADDLEVLTHELVHVRQYEELGNEGMARRVVIERIVLRGKTVIPIETEAVFETARILGTEPAYYPF
ncbi:MAG: hypothetical protein AAF826_04240 [Pseudomonadota bacterium]